MRDKVVIITGSGSGIGRHLTGAFLNSGALVAATDINEDALKKAAKKDGWDKERLISEKLDVRQEKSWKKLFSQVLKKWKRVDILINNAGYLMPAYIVDADEDHFARHLDINARGTMIGTAHAARVMMEQKSGHIINIASLAGVAGIPGISAYSASKHAVRGFSLAAAQEMRPHGVFVTTICPDAVKTPMLDLQKDYKEAAMTFSGGRYLTPVDIEEAIRRAIDTRQREILLPGYRGMLAKIASAFPSLTATLGGVMQKQGQKKQAAFRKGS